MQPFQEQVIHVFTNLAHILGKADKDGLDVYCTTSSKKKHDSRIENLVSFLGDHFRDGHDDKCFIDHSLTQLINKVIKHLSSRAGESPKRVLSLSGLVGRSHKGGPVSIYILTDGVCDSSGGGLCRADLPIKQLIEEIKRRNLSKTHVSIQFIRFGNDEIGIQRLTHLDDGLENDYPDL